MLGTGRPLACGKRKEGETGEGFLEDKMVIFCVLVLNRSAVCDFLRSHGL